MCFKKKNAVPLSGNASIYETERSCTDLLFLALMAIFFIGLLVLVTFCVPQSDIYRIINGYDDCGNVCGRDNYQNIHVPCSGQDMISRKYLMLIANNSAAGPVRECVSDCNGDGEFKLFLNRCIRFDILQRERASQSFLAELWQDVESFHLNILWLCLLGFFSSLLILALLWYIPRTLIWTLVFGAVVICVGVTGYSWIKWQLELEYATKWLYVALGSSLVSIFIGVLLIAFWQKVILMVRLLHELDLALKLRSMVLLIFLPVLTISIMIVTLLASACIGLMIESCGSATVVGSSVHYVKDYLVVIARWYNIVALIWFYHFLLGCQHMVAAGATSQWYFTRQEDRLQNVESRSFTMLVRYHLGTVALGSFLLAILLGFQWILSFLRFMTRKSSSNQPTNCCSNCCQGFVGCLQSSLEPITRKAYIATALHGQSFFGAGKRVAQIFADNFGQMLAVDVVGSIIFILVQLMVLVLVGFVGFSLIGIHRDELYHPYVLMAIVLTIVYLITNCCMLMYTITIDGVHLCFYIDTAMNNGAERPYFMSEELQKFIQGTDQAAIPIDSGSNPKEEENI